MIIVSVKNGIVFSSDVPYTPTRDGVLGSFDYSHVTEQQIGSLIKVEKDSYDNYRGPWQFQADVPLSQEQMIKVFHKLELVNMQARMQLEKGGVYTLPAVF